MKRWIILLTLTLLTLAGCQEQIQQPSVQNEPPVQAQVQEKPVKEPLHPLSVGAYASVEPAKDGSDLKAFSKFQPARITMPYLEGGSYYGATLTLFADERIVPGTEKAANIRCTVTEYYDGEYNSKWTDDLTDHTYIPEGVSHAAGWLVVKTRRLVYEESKKPQQARYDYDCHSDDGDNYSNSYMVSLSYANQ